MKAWLQAGHMPSAVPDLPLEIAHQVLIRLPDPKRMQVKAKVNESKIAEHLGEAIEKGLAWIEKNWGASNIGSDVYGAYALERLGIPTPVNRLMWQLVKAL